MVFNKHNEKNNRVIKKTSEWIIAVGIHPRVIPSIDWIKTQDPLKSVLFTK